MLQKLRDEAINGLKNTVCKRRGDFSKMRDCDEQILAKMEYCWNLLTFEEKHKLVTGLGKPLAPTLSQRLEELNHKEITPLGSPGLEWGPENASSGQRRGSYGDLSQALDSPKPDVRALDKSDILNLFDLILEWKAGELSKPSHTFVRTFQRLMKEKASSDLLIQFSKVGAIDKFFASRLFVGKKVVLSHQALPEFAYLLLQNSLEQSSALEPNRPSRRASGLSDKTKPDSSGLSVSEMISSDAGTDKPLKAAAITRDIEAVLFAFALVFENKLLELVNYQEVFYANSHGKLYSMPVPQQSPARAMDPDIVIVEIFKQTNHKPPQKYKGNEKSSRYFRQRRAYGRLSLECLLTSRLDFQAFQALACVNGLKLPSPIPDEDRLATMCAQEVEEFRMNMTNNKKKMNGGRTNYGTSYNQGYQQGFSNHRSSHYGGQFGNYIGNQGPMFQQYSNYGRNNFGNGRKR